MMPYSKRHVGNRNESLPLVIDSGDCLGCWGKWWNQFNKNSPTSQILDMQPISRSFRFGGSRTFQSLGHASIAFGIDVTGNGGVVAKQQQLTIKCDVVPCDIPLLVSRATPPQSKAVICFEPNTMRIGLAGRFLFKLRMAAIYPISGYR